VPAIATPTEHVTTHAGRELPARAAFYLQASIVTLFLAGSSAPTPLYAVYQAEWGFSPITVTVVFGVYAIAVLATLLTVGSLSDHIGRRPVLLVAIALQAVAMVIFASADGVPMLIVGRIAQGLATGAAVGAVGAGMLELDRVKGTVANGVAPIAGTATGALGSSLLVQYLPSPTHLVYLVLLAACAVQAIGVWLVAETSPRTPGALASLRPRFALPPAVRSPLLAAAPVLVAVWALGGFYASLGPSLVRTVAGSSSLVLGGLSLFILAGSGALTVLAVRNLAPRVVMLIGIGALLAGVGTTLLAISARSELVFLVGTAIAGVGFGGGFQGALRTIVPVAGAHERAGVISVVFLISYLALGVPAVIAGFLVVDSGGLLTTAREYGVAVMALAALALVGVWRRETEPRHQGARAVAARENWIQNEREWLGSLQAPQMPRAFETSS
jgi:predicted MFS family arabinose efflux permease